MVKKRGTLITTKCANPECGTEIEVRAADVARGWGKYCGKSCKAKHQASQRNEGK